MSARVPACMRLQDVSAAQRAGNTLACEAHRTLQAAEIIQLITHHVADGVRRISPERVISFTGTDGWLQLEFAGSPRPVRCGRSRLGGWPSPGIDATGATSRWSYRSTHAFSRTWGNRRLAYALRFAPSFLTMHTVYAMP
jgi:hypothetical protein